MEMLTENPIMIVLASGVITVILGLMYYQSQDRRVLPFLAIGGLLTTLPLLIDYAVTTDKESLKRTVQRMAASVRQNDLENTLKFVYPGEERVYRAIEAEMPTYDFSMCTVTGFRAVNFTNADKTEAEVKFNVFVNVSAPTFGGHEGVGQRGVTLNFRKTPKGQWRVISYNHYPPLAREKTYNK